MIAIVSSNPRERSALAAICESREWPHEECDSVRSLRRLLDETTPRVIIARARLSDGFFDDLIAVLPGRGDASSSPVILLIEAGTSSAQEARLISLGAATALRDPVRTEVLAAHVEKYRSDSLCPRPTANTVPANQGPLHFAGAVVHPLERRVASGSRQHQLTPRELQLLKLLAEAEGRVVTYHTLYSDILGRKFRGDSSNMRVLLQKLHASFALLQIRLRNYISVIPKTGYRYDGAQANCRAQQAPP
jgi:DNA-binding response OmpR family regulator